MTAIQKEVIIGDCRLLLGDCLSVMPELGRFDAVVTSPPYDDLREYGEKFNGVDCLAVIGSISRLLKIGGVCVWNVADATINGSESGSSFRQALHAIDVGLRLHDTMIYCKETTSFPDSNRYLPCFEYMFIFSQGAPSTFNPIKDRANKWRGSPMNGTDRQRDGSTKQISGIGKPIPNYGIRRNWWLLSNHPGREVGGHPAPMPYAMADGHIRTWTNPDDHILDPFMGSGTTGVACVKLGRKFTGIELDPDYFEIAVQRIKKAYEQPDMFVEAEKAPVPVHEGMDL